MTITMKISGDDGSRRQPIFLLRCDDTSCYYHIYKNSMSGCDEDVGHPRGKLGQYDDDDDYEKDVEHPRGKMIVMNMWASQGEVG